MTVRDVWQVDKVVMVGLTNSLFLIPLVLIALRNSFTDCLYIYITYRQRG